jgi:hypothetical protein
MITQSGLSQIPMPLEERLAEEPDLGEVGREERGVGAEQGPAGEEARPRAERHACERVCGAGMVEEARQADEGVRDERDRDRRQEKCQGDGPPDDARRRNAVQGHRRGRRHDADEIAKASHTRSSRRRVPRGRSAAAVGSAISLIVNYLLRRPLPG